MNITNSKRTAVLSIGYFYQRDDFKRLSVSLDDHSDNITSLVP
jgi:hypothetical protein